MQHFVHYFLHFGFPFLIAFFFFKKEWKKVALILLATMLVDIDHLLATPIFDPHRCSFGFHPLHSYYAMGVYFFLLFLKKPYSIIGFGLLLHILTDFIDCLFMYNACNSCLENVPAKGILETISRLLFQL
ncbi:DUF6122 family protein [Tenacibaculum tangerinum]|uniref:DUF6122 family protein n=1 Tax=Tenacibaculum tangerinum TaxID=3038772 RepID=A0ABY8L2B7_9FLAO|nr:DUF6122 family protein [Tenacibaculum tangerinum]WGH75593.1 DUF6122 family protein [Tenacibaculum tangerinum]